MKIHFTKMHGCGNDFVMIDNRIGILNSLNIKKFAKKICTRRFGVGSNGLILLENSHHADFKMRYFNSDGSIGEMCGNGARCLARFAFENNVVQQNMTFETLAGNYQASIQKDNTVTIFFPHVHKQYIELNQTLQLQSANVPYHYGIIGVPHTVIYDKQINNLNKTDFERWGNHIRHHSNFKAGTNVNRVEIINQQTISIRTYERGVEEETLACGSGACASAIMTALTKQGTAPFKVNTQGGNLIIDFKEEANWITNLSLSGNAVIVYEGIWKI